MPQLILLMKDQLQPTLCENNVSTSFPCQFILSFQDPG